MVSIHISSIDPQTDGANWIADWLFITDSWNLLETGIIAALDQQADYNELKLIVPWYLSPHTDEYKSNEMPSVALFWDLEYIVIYPKHSTDYSVTASVI